MCKERGMMMLSDHDKKDSKKHTTPNNIRCIFSRNRPYVIDKLGNDTTYRNNANYYEHG